MISDSEKKSELCCRSNTHHVEVWHVKRGSTAWVLHRVLNAPIITHLHRARLQIIPQVNSYLLELILCETKCFVLIIACPACNSNYIFMNALFFFFKKGKIDWFMYMFVCMYGKQNLSFSMTGRFSYFFFYFCLFLIYFYVLPKKDLIVKNC